MTANNPLKPLQHKSLLAFCHNFLVASYYKRSSQKVMTMNKKNLETARLRVMKN